MKQPSMFFKAVYACSLTLEAGWTLQMLQEVGGLCLPEK